jgi:hypothetical protein
MFKDSKTTKFSELENGDTFFNYDGTLMMVHNIKTTKSGRIKFDYSSSNQPNPRPYSNAALIDRIITTI